MSSHTTSRRERRGRLRRIGAVFARFRGGVSGATAVEFAIIFPVFLLIVMGLIEFGRVFWVQVSLRYAVEQTARNAMAEYTREAFTNSNFATWFSTWSSSLQASAPSEIFGWDPSAVTFTATTSQASGVDYVIVAASYSFDFLYPVIPGLSSTTLTAQSKTPLVGN